MPDTLRPRTRRLVALGLFLATCGVLLSTLDVGVTRDESFYFRYARSYAEWFTHLEEAEGEAEVHDVMGRDAVVRTWIGNFEHPPLMKTAFGASWRLLARKDRRLVPPPRLGGEDAPRMVVRGLSVADGFEEGAEVALLGPLRVGGDPTDPSRRMGRATVADRSPSHATLRLDEGAPAHLHEVCAGPERGGAVPEIVAGCQAREDRPLALLSEMTAMRLPAIVASGLAVALIFLLGSATVGWLAGLLAAVAFLFVPRQFFHAHQAAFDMAIVAGVLATLYAFWRSLTDRRWALAAGVCWGLALLVKHNAFFLPVPLLAWWLWSGRTRLRLAWASGRLRVSLPPIPVALLAMPVVAFPMLFVLWPKLWYDPFRAVSDYFRFHLQHDHYMQWYFGEPLEVPPFPFEFPFALTALTVPEAFLLLILVGIALALWRGRGRQEEPIPSEEAGDPGPSANAFLLLNGLVPVVLIALPSTPIFGGVKHWMTGMPFLLLFGGYALATALRRIARDVRRPWLRAVAVGAVLVLVYAQPIRASVRANAFGTGYWNSLVAGGAQGAADRKLMRLYWGYTTRPALPWLNEHAPRGARVFFQNTTYDAYDAYKRDGLLRHDIRYHHGPGGADVALIEPQKAFGDLDLRVRRSFRVAGPEEVVLYEGVPMLRIYARPERKPDRRERDGERSTRP
ncbi:MAG: ArnT family glycosyltransferase [Myxococcota bacterium]